MAPGTTRVARRSAQPSPNMSEHHEQRPGRRASAQAASSAETTTVSSGLTWFGERETLDDIAVLNVATRASQLENGLKDAGLQLLPHERSLVTGAVNDEWVEGTRASYLRVRGDVLAWILANA